jgi:hypothetical protein
MKTSRTAGPRPYVVDNASATDMPTQQPRLIRPAVLLGGLRLLGRARCHGLLIPPLTWTYLVLGATFVLIRHR